MKSIVLFFALLIPVFSFAQTSEELTLKRLQGEWMNHENFNVAHISKDKWTASRIQVDGESEPMVYDIKITNTLPQFPEAAEVQDKTEYITLTSASDTRYYEIISLVGKKLGLREYPSGVLVVYEKD